MVLYEFEVMSLYGLGLLCEMFETMSFSHIKVSICLFSCF